MSYKPLTEKNINSLTKTELYNRLYILEKGLKNGTLVELGRPYIKPFALKNSGRYIICKAQEVGISGVLNKAEAEAKLKELKEV